MIVNKISYSSLDKTKYNNGLIEELYPFEIVKGDVKVDTKWWSTLSGIEKNAIEGWCEQNKLHLDTTNQENASVHRSRIFLVYELAFVVRL
jgi:hypothetical protein